ncbi:MAG: histone deacetylase family protein [Promethearchaeota archaeon]
MKHKSKLGIVTDEAFSLMHDPPYPKPSFISFENPSRISHVITYLKKQKIFENEQVVRLEPLDINESALYLAHSRYHVDSIKRISSLGGGLLEDEVFITEDTFTIAKMAVGGAIQSISSIIKGEVNQSFALIRPPGHHALRENASGLCIFNNIANAIYYVREYMNYQEKIAIIDIDDHFGDGLARYFYEDPNVLYFSIHEYDFEMGDVGLIDELGANEGLGKNINFPVPPGIINQDFLKLFDVIKPILQEFRPSLIIVATGFDMYFADPIGNCQLTSSAYHQFAKNLLKLSEEICEGKLAFILEGGYSIIGLKYCVLAIINALLDETYNPPEFENISFPSVVGKEVDKIKNTLIKLLAPYWRNL